MDLHTHTIASGHHTKDTVTDLAKSAKIKGLTHLGITDHGPKMQGSANVNYFRNLRYCDKVLFGVKILYGVELNILNVGGDVDLDEDILKGLDYAVAGLHKQPFPPKTEEENTQALLNAMKNPYVSRLVEMLLLCKEKGVKIMLGSDSHGAEKVGDFKNAVKLLNLISFPEILVVNLNPKTFYEVLKTKQSQQF